MANLNTNVNPCHGRINLEFSDKHDEHDQDTKLTHDWQILVHHIRGNRIARMTT